MESKKTYEKPEIVVLNLEVEDVITCSGVGTTIFNTNGDIKDIWHF